MLPFFQTGVDATGRIQRRELLRIGSLATLGVSLPTVLGQTARADGLLGSARNCILVYLFGGPSHLETFDLKPEAPADFRGDFKPIATTVPGIEISEHYPLLAKQQQHYALIRSMHHEHPRHGWGTYHAFTGQKHSRPDLDAPPTPDDYPGIGALVAFATAHKPGVPPAITLPRWNKFNDLPDEYAGEKAGFLGKAFDPFLVQGNTRTLDFQVDGLNLPPGVTFDRLAERRKLLTHLDHLLARVGESAVGDRKDVLYSRALEIITSERARRAFDLTEESPQLRDRYGRHPFGQGLLLARRLIEAGTTLVTVNWHNDGSDVKSPFWDTHKDNFNSLKNRLMPPTDQGLSALLEDLSNQGLLNSTLVIVTGEFGRTPRIGRVVMNAATDATGRDHWPHAYSAMLAGGGVQGGLVHGASDNRAAFVAQDPVTPPDLIATILSALGIDPSQPMPNRLGINSPLATGTPVRALF